MESSINCIHFGPCSGCTLSKQVTDPPLWSSIKEYLGPSPVESLEVGLICRWRTKAKLAVRGTSAQPLLGLFRAGTHDAMAIPHCKVHHPAINRAVEVLVQTIREEKIIPYNEKTGDLRYVQCLVDLKTDKIQLVLVWNAKESTPFMTRFAKRLLESDLWHSIWFNFQPNTTNRIFGDHWALFSGEPLLFQDLNGISIPFHPASFSQAHWTLFERLAGQVVAWIPKGAHLLEIYAGVGALGLLAAPHCKTVDLVENNPFAHLSFQAAKAPSNVRFHTLDAKEALPFLERADCILVDPPRKGLEAPLLEALKTWQGTLLYVSCDFASFRRDADALQKAGWTLSQAKGYLLFPGTDQVEIVARLCKI